VLYSYTPFRSHRGWDFKKQKKKNIELQRGMKLSLTPNLDDFFLNSLNQSLILWRQQPGGDEASNEGCNSGSTWHDFLDNFINLALFHPAFRLSSSDLEKSRFYFWVFSTLLITLLSKTRILIFNCVKETKSWMISSGLFWNH
jgi:hypothetical protein